MWWWHRCPQHTDFRCNINYCVAFGFLGAAGIKPHYGSLKISTLASKCFLFVLRKPINEWSVWAIGSESYTKHGPVQHCRCHLMPCNFGGQWTLKHRCIVLSLLVLLRCCPPIFVAVEPELRANTRPRAHESFGCLLIWVRVPAKVMHNKMNVFHFPKWPQTPRIPINGYSKKYFFLLSIRLNVFLAFRLRWTVADKTHLLAQIE